MKKKVGTLVFKVDWPALALEIVHHTEVRDSPGTIMGMQILNRTLHKIGVIAVNRKDKEMLTLLEKIGVVKE